jgi:hypothetical protein
LIFLAWFLAENAWCIITLFMCFFFRLWIMDSETPSDKPDELEIYRQWAESGRGSNDRIWQTYRMFGSIF